MFGIEVRGRDADVRIGLEASKARDLKAWANGQGKKNCFESQALKARNEHRGEFLFRAFSAQVISCCPLPGALPQAITLRAIGAFEAVKQLLSSPFQRVPNVDW